jgi:hypothetical protein
MFTSDEGRPIDPFWRSTGFCSLVRAAAVPVIHLQGLKHGHTSLLPIAGVAIEAASERLRCTMTAVIMIVHGQRPARDGRRRWHAPGRSNPWLTAIG